MIFKRKEIRLRHFCTWLHVLASICCFFVLSDERDHFVKEMSCMLQHVLFKILTTADEDF